MVRFLYFSLSPLPVIRPAVDTMVFRLFPPGPSLPSPSSSFRFFKFHSFLIACAFRTRAADFGIASFRNDSFPGANSDPLVLKKSILEITKDLNSEFQADVPFLTDLFPGRFLCAFVWHSGS